MTNLADCRVEICDRMGAVRINKIKGCQLYLGPVQGSLLIEDCVDCVIHIASRQIRIHDAHECQFFLHVISNPIIEHSSGVGFAPYGITYDALEDQMKCAGLLVPAQGDGSQQYKNLWSNVDDFNWLRQQHSPNWYEVIEGDRPSTVHL